MATTMTVKGQVTVPKPIRDELGLKPGRPVLFVHNAAGEVVVKAGERDEVERERRYLATLAAIEAVRGTVDLGMTTDEYMAIIRDPIDVPAR